MSNDATPPVSSSSAAVGEDQPKARYVESVVPTPLSPTGEDQPSTPKVGEDPLTPGEWYRDAAGVVGQRSHRGDDEGCWLIGGRLYEDEGMRRPLSKAVWVEV